MRRGLRLSTLIPAPQQLTRSEGVFRLTENLDIGVPPGADAADLFAAQDLAAVLREEHGVTARVVRDAASAAVSLRRRESEEPRCEGYVLTVEPDRVQVSGDDAAGVYWGTRTLLQAARRGSAGSEIPCMNVVDWPDVRHRAIHYDTKHH